MRGTALITLENGCVYRGTIQTVAITQPKMIRVGGFGPFSHEVVAEPGRMTLELLGVEPVSLPSPEAPIPAPEPEDAPAEWGAYA